MSTAVTTLKKTHSILGNQVLTLLPNFPEQAAEAIRPLMKELNIEGYKHFLYCMYHYTLDSAEKLEHSCRLCDDKNLLSYFSKMIKEEKSHYLLAKRDYEAFGLEVNKDVIPEPVKRFREFWYGLGNRNCNEFVGGMYVFESVAGLVGKDVIDMIERLQLTKRQSRWLLVHLEADLDHGAHALEMCEEYVDADPQALLDAAREGVERWIDVFKFAFTNPS